MSDKPHEVWVSNELRSEARGATYRFNARFAEFWRACEEVDWYVSRGYYAEVHDTGSSVRIGFFAEARAQSDDDEEEDYESDGVLEYPEGSGG